MAGPRLVAASQIALGVVVVWLCEGRREYMGSGVRAPSFPGMRNVTAQGIGGECPVISRRYAAREGKKKTFVGPSKKGPTELAPIFKSWPLKPGRENSEDGVSDYSHTCNIEVFNQGG